MLLPLSGEININYGQKERTVLVVDDKKFSTTPYTRIAKLT